MSTRDFREFIGKLEQEGQLVRFHEEILPEPDVRGVGRGAVDLGPTGPAVLMDNIKGYKGKQLALNVHGSWANYAIMMGMPKNTSLKEMFYELARRWDRYPGEVKRVNNPVCQQNVIRKNINLYEIFPLFRVNPYDGGCYFAKASVVTNDLDEPDEFDKTNVGMYRLQVQGPDTIGLGALPFHDLGMHVRHAEAANRPLPIAICLGVHPMLSVMACTPIAYGKSEYKYAAALDGAPMEIAKALTSDLDIPAGCEYVIEGKVLPRQRFP
jgi:UbiD family decarboxylase